MKIADILSEQGGKPETAGPTDTVAEVSSRMRDLRIGVVLIVDKDQSLVGIVSERDIVKASATGDGAFVNGPAIDIGTRDVVTCTPESRPDAIYKDMLERKIRHMPVIEAGKVIGMVSMTDLLRYYRDTNTGVAATKILDALSAGAIRSSL